MTICPHKSPFGYYCTLEHGHTGPHRAEGERDHILDTWTDEEARAFHRYTVKSELPIQIRRYGGWRTPAPGEIQQMLQDGHQVTIRRAQA